MKRKILRTLVAALALAVAVTTIAPASYASEIDTTTPVVVVDETTEADVEDVIEVEVVTEDAIVEDSSTSEEVTVETETYDTATSSKEENEEDEEDEEAKIVDYTSFMSALKVLEGYADTYAKEHAGEDAVELVMNYVRTGVAKYNGASWDLYAGVENTAFVTYVATQDAKNNTSASALRSVGEFKTPNGDLVDFKHMFGCMNITYYSAMSKPADEAILIADMSGWAGDTADLMEYTVNKVTSTDVESMTTEIKENYLGVDDKTAHGFGLIDMKGDLDGYYIANSLGGGKTISTIMDNYFNKNLSDKTRAIYFIENRFGGAESKEDLRNSLYAVYADEKNGSLRLVEQSKGVADKADLRKACCYAFADWLFEQAGIVTDKDINDYYSVYSTVKSTLAPGVTQEIKKATTADDKQMVYYLATADITRDDVSIHANYHDNVGTAQGDWATTRVMDQMQAAIKYHTDPTSDWYVPNYQPVAGTNGDFFDMTTGEPSGVLIMEGVKYHEANTSNFFGVLNNGTPIIGNKETYKKYEGQFKEALGGSVWLVKDGKIAVTATSDYYASRASRTAIGITADNKVVLMVLDGRQEPVSCGGSMLEIAQIMYDAGCVSAINLDGGGSTTYIAKEEGADELSVVNNPSDGYDRSVSSSVMIVSTAKPSTEFSHALVLADCDYMTVGTSVSVKASGVSVSGGSADIPEGSVLKVVDESIGTLKDGVFTAKKSGDVVIQLVNGDKVLGKKTLHVVVPNELVFEKEHFNIVYGVPTDLSLMATYNGNKIAINENDVKLTLEAGKEVAGTIDGFTFTGNEASAIRSVRVDAVLINNPEVTASAQIALYNEGEAVFDFDTATAGDRKFAFKRVINNTVTADEKTYYIDDRDKDIEGSYVFALDMKEIPLPTELESIIGLLPGADDADASAWNFLLQLAERISVLTEVTVKIKIDSAFDVDYSEVKLVNEYFTLTSTDYDKNSNTLIVKFNWIDQTQPIEATTANSMCILSGIKFTPKDGAEEVIEAELSGSVDYDFFLRSNTVYGLAADPEMQALGLRQFINPNDSTEKGAAFKKADFVTMTDNFVIDMMDRNGWMEDANGDMYYYVDNVIQRGIQLLPDMDNANKKAFYDLGTDGVCIGKVTGLFKYDGNLYYADERTPGVAITNTWWTIVNGHRDIDYYYFDAQGKAVDGVQKIDGYTYTFEENVLVRGELVKNDYGTRYMWAGEFASQTWLDIDGNISYAQRSTYFATGIYKQYNPEGEYQTFAFDEDGVLLDDLVGLFEYNGDLYFVENGIIDTDARNSHLEKIGSYIYFFVGGKAVTDRTKWVDPGQTNGLVPDGSYRFDEEGRMVLPGDVARISGKTRYETCFNIANTLKADLDVQMFDTVIVASGKNFADALAGSYLASVKNAPILMTDGSDKYNATLHDYIKANVTPGGKVYILGGTGALPATVEAGLDGYDVERLSGKTRYETNIAILNEAGVSAGEDVLICTGASFADSLSASATGKPILLVDSKKALTDGQKTFLASVKESNFYIIGGTGAVSEDVEKEIETFNDATRISGKTRYETSVKLAETFFADAERVVLAYAGNFPDGLSGGPLAYSMDAPLILTSTEKATAADNYAEAFSIRTGKVLGGEKLISDAAAKEIFGMTSKETISLIK